MVKIRLSRVGRKNLAHYRVVAVQAREKRDTNAIELLGHYSPFTKELVLNEELRERSFDEIMGGDDEDEDMA
jgi:small subunit ribosomal protein S16